MTSAAMAICAAKAITAALAACSRASAMFPLPIERETSAVAAIISPTPLDTEKNCIAKAKPMAATMRGSPSCETQNRFSASMMNTKVIPAAPVRVIRITWPIVGPLRNRASCDIGYSAGLCIGRDSSVS